MAELCLDCLNKFFGRKFKKYDVILEDDLCEECGEWKPCVVKIKEDKNVTPA